MEILITILPYIISLIASPVISGVISYIMMLILGSVIPKNSIATNFTTVIIGITSGFSAVWFTTIVFSWFSDKAGIIILVILIIVFLQNHIYRIKTKGKNVAEYGAITGEYIGIIISAMIFIF